MIKRAKFVKPINEVIDDLCDQIINTGTKDLGWLHQSSKSGCIVGISGGIDSAVVAYLCYKAVSKYLGLKLFLLEMPSQYTSEESLKYSQYIIDDLKDKFHTKSKRVFINSIVNTFNRANVVLNLSKYDFGNLQSEIRAVMLSRYAAKYNLLVMGTGNHDEDTVLGYFTKRGDGAVDNNILGNIPKRLVYELAKELKVPEEIINRKPTAELWKGQSDETELGFTYDIAELVYNGKHKHNMSTEEIMEELNISREIVHKVLDMNYINRHKSQLSPVGKVELVFEKNIVIIN